jgi:hypothetical protein
MIFCVGFGDIFGFYDFFFDDFVLVHLIVPDDLDDLSFGEFWDITEDLTEFIVIPPVIACMTKDEHITTLWSTSIGISDDTTLEFFFEITFFQLLRSIITKINDRSINSQIINNDSIVRWESIENERVACELIFEMIFGIKVEVIIGCGFYDVDFVINNGCVSTSYHCRSQLSDTEQIFHNCRLE